MNLQQIGAIALTDKSRHSYKGVSYLNIYDNLFHQRRLGVKCFVEIGVLNGASLRMWADYFPNALIFGIDINPECKKHESERIKILIGDQSDDGFLSQIRDQIPCIDILIDDGSHITRHQIQTFTYLFSRVIPGGFYVVEDLRNSYEEFIDGHNLRKIWPGMCYNKDSDSLKNARKDFNDWMLGIIKQMDFHDKVNQVCAVHNYPMIMVLEKALEG